MMKTLLEFDTQQQEYYDALTEVVKPHPNGVECPNVSVNGEFCKKELWDSDPSQTLTTDPPRKSIHCPACGYSSSRIA